MLAAANGVVRAGIVITGTEVITGTIADRNGPWISKALGELGVEVAHILVVGDRPSDLEAALRFMADDKVDLIVTSGGLGPTADDLTAEVVGRFAGREMVLDAAMEEKIAAILRKFAARLKFDPEALRDANRKQAVIPDGALTIDPAGTAPGLVVPVEGGPVVIVMPGPPRELQAMWPKALDTGPAREVLGRAKPYSGAMLRLFGLPESEIAKSLREVADSGLDLSPLEITTCLRKGELEIEVRHRPGAEQTLATLIDAIDQRHGRFLFSRDGATIDSQLSDLLEGHTVATAESCTAGMLAARLTELEGASRYVAGGVVAYSNGAKTDVLGVSPELIDEHGAVSPQVAEAMADGAIARFEADLGVGITGIAGPTGGTEAKPVGYVCICVKSADRGMIARDPVIPGTRADIRERSALLAMHLMRRLLLGEDFPI
ncbi:MAG: competence/damage-inducible protein A [Actinomycetota bacterium]|nr:competence/damage-inducible protein A [Actinomycetota bacterium]